MYTDGEPKGEVKKFIDFAKGPDGQKIVEEEGFVPLKK
jgi:phosphate transport system substrate-binding protein